MRAAALQYFRTYFPAAGELTSRRMIDRSNYWMESNENELLAETLRASSTLSILSIHYGDSPLHVIIF